MKRAFTLMIALILVCASVFALGSCGDPVPGPQGEKGEKGDKGDTPTITISEDGYWVINGEKTNVRAEADGGSSDAENPQGLAFYLKDDGTYAVAIGNAKYLSKIVIPATYCGKAVTEIATLGFGDDSVGNTVLKEITIPDSVTSIGDKAFYACRSLTGVTIPDSVTSIGIRAFQSCDSLTSVTIGNGVTSISDYAFYKCSILTGVTIGNSVTSIGDYAFYNCSSLTGVAIPDSVTNIGNSAFYGCDSLTGVTIGNGVTSIGSSAFSSCSSLANISVDVNNEYYSSLDGNLYDKNQTTLIQYAIGKTNTHFVIPSTVTRIGNNAFSGCSSLISVTIGNGVTRIGNNAFEYCSSLNTVYYTGTATEWGGISIPYGNDYLKNATRYYYSESEPTTQGKFWHYIDGVPTKW